MDTADVPADVIDIGAHEERPRNRGAERGALEHAGTEILLILRVAKATTQLEALSDVVCQRAERSPCLVPLRLLCVSGLRPATEQGVVTEAVDGDVLVEIEHATLPVQRACVVRFDAELLRPLAVIGEAVGRF